MEQTIITGRDNYIELDRWLEACRAKRVFLVCDASLPFLRIRDYFDALEGRMTVVRFDDFQPNPLYESVVRGVGRFRESDCDAIIAVGGGSAMDVAKCVKLYSNMAGDGADGGFLKQPIVPNGVPFLAVPTTAGTGSEATRYAVIYYEGRKQSVTSESCIPGTVLMDSSALKTLPLYQKKATMLDALCHAVESFWSVNSTEESKAYSKRAIQMVMANMEGYLANVDAANANMLAAAHTAGRAINITQTTAGHAMCYKLTSLFGCAHGHAAMLCDRVLFPWMLAHTDRCVDPRGEAWLKEVFREIAEAMGCDSPEAAARRLNEIFDSLGLEVPSATPEQYAALRTSVNPVRLKNHPIALDIDAIDELYHQILR